MRREQPKRRFPPPWTIRRIAGGYAVDDATGFALVYVYGRDHSHIADEGLTLDECRRIALGIAKLPDLLS